MSAELENNFKNIQIELNKGSIRVFDIMLDEGPAPVLIFSKTIKNRFPKPGELTEIIDQHYKARYSSEGK